MAVTSQTIENPYAGPFLPNGVTTSFQFKFKAASPEELKVVTLDEAGNQTTIDPGEYMVSLVDEGGTVTFSIAPLASAGSLFILSDPSFEQRTEFEDHGPVRAVTLNSAFDRFVLQDIFLKDQVGRSLRVPFGETAPTLPSLSGQFSKMLGTTSTGAMAWLDRGEFRGPKGDPGGNVQAIGTFLSAATDGVAIPAGTETVRTSGYQKAGDDGAAHYAVADAEPAHPAKFQDASGRWFELVEPILKPKMFGANGQGTADDHEAIQAMGVYATLKGGALIHLRPGAVYRVGRQTFSGVADGAAYRNENMLRFDNCNGVTISGFGAKFKLNDGQYYGSFDPVTGAVFNPPGGGFTDANYAATIGHIIEFNNCRNLVVEDVRIDGNQSAINKGGYWGDTGIQRRANGLTLAGVSDARIVNVSSNDNGLDGFYVRGNEVSKYGAGWDGLAFDNLTADRNGRQGMSIVGGRGIYIKNSTFKNTGQGLISSLPKAGVDFEPNGADWASEIMLDNSVIENNAGVGLLCDAAFNVRNLTVKGGIIWQGFGAASGDALWLAAPSLSAIVEGVIINGCVTNSAAGVIYRDCVFDGATPHPVYGQPATNRPYLFDPARSQFYNCRFTSLDRRVINAVSGALFENCVFTFTGAMADKTVVMAFPAGVTLRNCSTPENCFPPPANGYQITRGATVEGRVTIPGPYVRWGSWDTANDPRIGTVRQTTPSFNSISLYGGNQEFDPRTLSYFNGTVPTSGTYTRGDIVFPRSPSAGGAPAQSCTTSGAAGSTAVFKAWANLAA